MRLSELFKTTGETFTFYPSFCHRFDISVNAAVFLCFIGWKTIPDTDGWREFNSEAITAGTGLSEKEQRTARAALKAAGLLEEDHNRWEHKMFFRLAGIEISEGARELPKGRSRTAKRALDELPKGRSSIGKEVLKEEDKEGSSLPVEAQEVVDTWNASPFPRVRAMPAARKRTLAASLRDPFFRDNWREALVKVAASPFCLGQNDRGWRADFDFFCRPSSFVKIMEGKYDDTTTTKQTGTVRTTGKPTVAAIRNSFITGADETRGQAMSVVQRRRAEWDRDQAEKQAARDAVATEVAGSGSDAP